MAVDPAQVTAIIGMAIGIFGALAVSFLWLRDARIFARTGLQGYRSAAYKGVLFTALGWLGAAFCSGMIGDATLMYIGFGLVLLALFLQSRIKKENVWTGSESGWQRFIGSAPRQGRK
ncbi:MAG TPA: ABC transporter permease [Methanocorpusculum sp.]|nr:ABC transporter permease [Methanocorpusculum sp.]